MHYKTVRVDLIIALHQRRDLVKDPWPAAGFRFAKTDHDQSFRGVYINILSVKAAGVIPILRNPPMIFVIGYRFAVT